MVSEYISQSDVVIIAEGQQQAIHMNISFASKAKS